MTKEEMMTLTVGSTVYRASENRAYRVAKRPTGKGVELVRVRRFGEVREDYIIIAQAEEIERGGTPR